MRGVHMATVVAGAVCSEEADTGVSKACIRLVTEAGPDWQRGDDGEVWVHSDSRVEFLGEEGRRGFWVRGLVGARGALRESEKADPETESGVIGLTNRTLEAFRGKRSRCLWRWSGRVMCASRGRESYGE